MEEDATVTKAFDILDLIHSEAGIVALILVLVVVGLSFLYHKERNTNKELSDKLYNLGLATVEQLTPMNNTLEKMYTLLIQSRNTTGRRD